MPSKVATGMDISLSDTCRGSQNQAGLKKKLSPRRTERIAHLGSRQLILRLKLLLLLFQHVYQDPGQEIKRAEEKDESEKEEKFACL